MQELPTDVVAMMYNEERKELADDLHELIGYHERAVATLAATKIQVVWQKKLTRFWKGRYVEARAQRNLAIQLVDRSKEAKDLLVQSNWLLEHKIDILEETIREYENAS